MLLAKQGHTVFALDSNPSMLAHARQKADAEGVSVKFLKEDMQEFSVPVQVFSRIVPPSCGQNLCSDSLYDWKIDIGSNSLDLALHMPESVISFYLKLSEVAY